MNLPENVNKIITALENSGFCAYAVGGCVRDSIMHKSPKDWDICTSAEPWEIQKVFAEYKLILTGMKHGTITVLAGEAYEVTSFRTDGEYTDCRHPESVSFTKNITADLARRDFTVNAIAYNPKTGIVDPFGGCADIENKILRTVGDAKKRFTEDALRILRGVRFCATLGFEVEEETAKQMIELAPLLENVSRERVAAELVRTLTEGKVSHALSRFRDVLAQIIPEMRASFDFDQRTPHHAYDVYTHILRTVDNYNGKDECVKLALLFHDCAKPLCCKIIQGQGHFKGHGQESAKIAREVLKRLKMSNKTIERTSRFILCHDVRLTGGMAQMLKLMKYLGDEDTEKLLEIMYCDVEAQSMYCRSEKTQLLDNGRKNFIRAKEENLCRNVGMLKIKGYQVKEMGLTGRNVGAALSFALNAVMNGKVQNDEAALKSYIDKFFSVW